MAFWSHSWKQRRIREEIAAHQREVVVAKAALAGWRWIEVRNPDVVDGWPRYQVFDPSGNNHGTNTTIYGAARYAMGVMEHEERSSCGLPA